MTISPKQRKYFWISVAVLVAGYYAPAIIRRASPPARLSRGIQDLGTDGASSGVGPIAGPYSFRDLTGIYNGRTVLPARGLCNLKFELRTNRLKPTAFSGYATLVCGQTPSLPRLWLPASRVAFLKPKATSVILTGESDESAIRFSVIDTVSVADGCAPTSFTVKRFGANQIAVRWIDSCRGGAMLLNRTGR